MVEILWGEGGAVAPTLPPTSDYTPVAYFKILHISSTFTNITIPFGKSISKKSTMINIAILWNDLFSNISCKTNWSNVFFTFDVSFLIKTFFASSFIAMHQKINLFFAFKNKNYCYVCCFYHVHAFDLIIWLIG